MRTHLFSRGCQFPLHGLLLPEKLLIFILERLKASRELDYQLLRLAVIHHLRGRGRRGCRGSRKDREELIKVSRWLPAADAAVDGRHLRSVQVLGVICKQRSVTSRGRERAEDSCGGFFDVCSLRQILS